MPDALTLLSVKFGSSQWLLENARLAKALNPDVDYRWLVVNNDNDLEFERAAHGLTVLPAAERPVAGDRGSAHHAAALMSALTSVDTRFLLVIDHDFFVVRRDWMREITAHVRRLELSFFGAVWHPRWSYQYRDFPSVHFMLIDLERVAVNQLDFTPGIGSDPWDNFVSSPKTPLPSSLRALLQVGRLRDTGYRIQRRFARSAHRFETLLPHYDLVGETQRASGLHRFAQTHLPQRFSALPKNAARVTPRSFLRDLSPAAYAAQWEEFFWQGQPFAFHLRMVGRQVSSESEFSYVKGLSKYFQ